jgi:hypothetical protein
MSWSRWSVVGRCSEQSAELQALKLRRCSAKFQDPTTCVTAGRGGLARLSNCRRFSVDPPRGVLGRCGVPGTHRSEARPFAASHLLVSASTLYRCFSRPALDEQLQFKYPPHPSIASHFVCNSLQCSLHCFKTIISRCGSLWRTHWRTRSTLWIPLGGSIIGSHFFPPPCWLCVTLPSIPRVFIP